MKRFLSFFFGIILTSAFGGPGDTTKVISHNSVNIVTNPSSGSNEYKRWAVFPAASKKFRKVYVTMSYKCASGMPCGAWDYIDNVYLRRIGGQNAPSKNIEIVRFITPYGNWFGSTWKFMWHMDISDYQQLMHDSVEVGYIHTGYEGTNVGWNLTMTFHFIEGTPVYEPVNLTTLWDRNFWWSQVNDSTKPQTVSMQPNTNIARIRMNHTGHGADTVNYCSEFCPRYRKLKIDGSFVDSVNVWRLCGTNALYPQAGTWVYDRGGWCPGALVYPYIYDGPVIASSTHTIDMSVVYPFTPTNQGNEVITAHLIECKGPQYTNDASIEEIFNPSLSDEYARFNAACARPKVLIRNNGTNNLTSLKLTYGMSGQALQTYTWTGNLTSHKLDTVTLPGVVNPTVNAQWFKVYCSDPNGNTDGWKYDDTLRSQANKVVNYVNDTIIIIETTTNNFGNETGYQVFNSAGTLVKQRAPGTLANNTLYRDTVPMLPDCYSLRIIDTGGDGLYWWANTAQGSGSFRFRKYSNTILRVFPTDFGSEYVFNFTTGVAFATNLMDNSNERLINLYPNPAKEYFMLDMNLGRKQNVKVEVMDALGKIIISKNSGTGSDQLRISTSELSKGLYFVNINGEDFREVRKLIVE
jgi:hypothetical protein